MTSDGKVFVVSTPNRGFDRVPRNGTESCNCERIQSQELLDEFWLWSMQGGLKNLYDIKAFSETDFHEDLKKFDVPTLVMHGEDDQIVPINISGKRSAKPIKGAKEIFYPDLPHGLTATNADQVNGDLLKFLKSVQQGRKAA